MCRIRCWRSFVLAGQTKNKMSPTNSSASIPQALTIQTHISKTTLNFLLTWRPQCCHCWDTDRGTGRGTGRGEGGPVVSTVWCVSYCTVYTLSCRFIHMLHKIVVAVLSIVILSNGCWDLFSLHRFPPVLTSSTKYITYSIL